MDEQRLDYLFNQYLQYGQVLRNYAPATITAYKFTFQLFLRESGCKTLKDATSFVMQQYLYNSRINRKWSAVTFRQHHKHLNAFFKLCVKQNMIRNNPLEGVEKPKLEKRLPKNLSEEDAELVLHTGTYMKYVYQIERYRNPAIVGLMLFAGLRSKEVLNLVEADICLKNKQILIRQAKGAKDRIVAINERLLAILEKYIQERKKLNRDSVQFILGVKKKPFTKCGIQSLFKRLKAKTNIKVTPHMLRHTFATMMLEGGCDLYTLKDLLGHEKITTTEIYLSCSIAHMSKSIEKHKMNSFGVFAPLF